VQKNRWCLNIGRAHKSNGIAVEVDLTFLVLTQVCFDPDCRGYRSEPIPLPFICCSVCCKKRSDMAGAQSPAPERVTLHQMCEGIHATHNKQIVDNINVVKKIY
jgi:hypothetical protein